MPTFETIETAEELTVCARWFAWTTAEEEEPRISCLTIPTPAAGSRLAEVDRMTAHLWAIYAEEQQQP